MALLRLKDVFSLLILCFLMITVNNVAAANQTIKNYLPADSAIAAGNIFQEPELSTVVTYKSPKQAAEQPSAAKQNANEVVTTKSAGAADQQKQSSHPSEQRSIAPIESWVHTVEETQHNLKAHLDYDDEDLPDSYITGFYIFLGLSIGAMLFILVKVYRLRLSRAERKYGVQGDRSTQELVPLPVSVEDGVSEDEDQTLFEVNRQQIRIL